MLLFVIVCLVLGVPISFRSYVLYKAFGPLIVTVLLVAIFLAIEVICTMGMQLLWSVLGFILLAALIGGLYHFLPLRSWYQALQKKNGFSVSGVGIQSIDCE